MRPALDRLFKEYADAHRHPKNRLTHKVAIPMIVFTAIAMFDWWILIMLPTGHAVTAAHTGLVVASAWYLYMDPKLGLIMVAGMVACIPLGWITPWWLVVALAVIGWTIQLIGHSVYEKNRPAFMKNMQQALVGPMFFIARARPRSRTSGSHAASS